MGVSVPIGASGLFPTIDAKNTISLDELAAQESWSKNHPSFNVQFDEDEPPGLTVIREHVNHGHGELFSTVADAEVAFGRRLHPAPMGNISKTTATGTKHRVLQDLRIHHVNEVAVVPERSFLPRGVDHALDLAKLSAQTSLDEVEVLILDFKDAFMSIPLNEKERPLIVR